MRISPSTLYDLIFVTLLQQQQSTLRHSQIKYTKNMSYTLQRNRNLQHMQVNEKNGNNSLPLPH